MTTSKVYDLLGLAAASRASVSTVNTTVPMAESLARSAVFAVMAGFVDRLPFATDSGKHDAAAAFFSSSQADIVVAQECADGTRLWVYERSKISLNKNEQRESSKSAPRERDQCNPCIVLTLQ